jgi:hypothetical protein
MSFETKYQADANTVQPATGLGILEKLEAHATGIQDFFRKYNGATFNQGLYRLVALDQLRKLTGLAEAMHPELKGKIVVFGTDWRGQFYALDARRQDNGQYQVILLDPATKEILNVPATFASFHHEEIVEYPEDALQTTLYQQWLDAQQVAPQAHECVGYIKPLVLSGQDDMANQEITDLEVYWSLLAQIHEQVANLPPGTKIDQIVIE